MNPEVVNQIEESPEEQASIQAGQYEARQELDDIRKASGQSREDKMEAAVKKILGPQARGMTLEEIMQLSEEEIQGMIDGRRRKVENMQKIGKFVSKLVTAFGEKGSDPVNMLLEKLNKIVNTDPEKLKKELKNFPPEKRKEVLAVFNAFIAVVVEKKMVHAALVPVYASFIIKLFTDKDYLTLHKKGTQTHTKLEEDILKWGSIPQVGPEIVHGVLKPSFINAFDALGGKNLANMRSTTDVEQRFTELVSPSQLETAEGRKLSLTDFIADREGGARGSFEYQRVQKLTSDVAKTLNVAVDGLFEDQPSITFQLNNTTQTIQKAELLEKINRFERDETANWGNITVLLYGYLDSLERQPSTTIHERRKQAQKIAKLRTVIASRNALDFLVNSGNVTRTFLPFYERHFRYQVALMKSRKTGTPVDIENATVDDYHSNQFTDEERQTITSETTTRIRESVIFTVSNVYRNYLNMKDEPKEAYEQALQHGGDYTSNPREMFRQLTNMLGNLAHQSSNVDKGKLDFSVTGLGKMQTLYDPLLGKDISTFSSFRTQLGNKTPHDFFNELLEEVKADDAFFEAGHQYRYLSNMGSPDAQKKFFQSIGDHLKSSMTARNIDRIYSMEDNVFISRCASFIETILKKRLGEKAWINEDEGKFFSEIFLNKGEGGRTLVLQVQEFLEENYPHLPDWQRRRVLQHAFTIVFAGRFRYQQVFSYANPTRGYQGQADDKQMFNNVFAPYQRLLRFPPDWNHDLSLKGAYWQPLFNMPGTNMPGKWDPFAAGKEGFKVFNEQRHEHQGRLAWDMTEYFQDDIARALGPINALKAGGYDTLRGWRRMADMGVIDKRLYVRNMGGGIPQFRAEYKDTEDLDDKGNPKKKIDGITRLWKSVENIGVNDLNAFVDADIVGMIAVNKEGKYGSQEAIDHFLGHIYSRYLHDGHEFGKHLPHNYLFGSLNAKLQSNLEPVTIARKYFNANMFGRESQRATSKEDFIAKFHARVQQLYQSAVYQESRKKSNDRKVDDVANTQIKRQLVKPMLYDAMLVVIAERSPIEFLYRLKNQDEQNGLRLSTQIKNKYFDEQSELNSRKGSFAETLSIQASIDDKLRDKLSSGNPDIRSGVKDEIWDEVTDDLAFVQGELRGEVDEEILANRKTWEGKTKGLNIYGENFDQDRSSVNGGKGYVMDTDTVIRVMLKKFRPDLEGQIRGNTLTAQAVLQSLLTSSNKGERVLGLRIQRAVLLRNDILAEMGRAPDINATGNPDQQNQVTEHLLRKKYLNDNGTIKSGLSHEDHVKAERYLKNLDKRVNRARWFRRMWDEGYLGAIPFMADNSEVHKVFLNSDDTVVHRSTGECGTSEQLKLILDARAPAGIDSNMLLLLKDAARKGTPETWGKLKSMGNAFRKLASDEIGDLEIYMPVFLDLYKIQLSGFANKQEVRNALGRWKMIFDKEGQSLFSKAWTNFEHHGMDAVTIRQFLLQVAKTGGMNPETMEGFASFFQASWFHVAKELIPEYLTYILAFALVSYITDSLKKANTKK